MDIKEFVELYNKVKVETAKEKLINEHIVRTYVPVGEKAAALKGLLEGSVRVNENGIKYIDLVANKINYVYGILLLYTDLEPIKSDDVTVKFLETYDVLQESGLINIICSHIGERELGELTFINDQVLDTWYTQNTSTKAYVSDLVSLISRNITEITTLLKEIPIDEITDKIDKEKVEEIVDSIKKDYKEVK